ncbi:hypothetical protein BKA70DRAFT_1267054 [Coprinopsis sp. MPI-PUGE-AT-0042]|nr:hypothetical protein BKA70DRAFT_1267054 [Coprinopsis sp. MPI-PUGE-AT-0042]
MQLVFDRYAGVLTMKQAGMHRCLCIPEILDVIFSSFDGWWRSTNRTLAMLARTCRAFYEPAIRALWRRLPGFEPIVKLLPTHTYHFNPDERLYVRQLRRVPWPLCTELSVDRPSLGVSQT